MILSFFIYIGVDVIKNDGIYSRYFFFFVVNGRYSLKVYVRYFFSMSFLIYFVLGSYVMYVLGYIVNGKNY